MVPTLTQAYKWTLPPATAHCTSLIGLDSKDTQRSTAPTLTFDLKNLLQTVLEFSNLLWGAKLPLTSGVEVRQLLQVGAIFCFSCALYTYV